LLHGAPQGAGDADAMHRRDLPSAEGVIHDEVPPSHGHAGGQTAVVPAGPDCEERMNPDLESGVHLGANARGFLEVQGQKRRPPAEGRLLVGDPRSNHARIADALPVETDGWLGHVSNGNATAEALHPLRRRSQEGVGLRPDPQIRAEAGPAETGEALALELDRPADAERLGDRPPEAQGDLGLRVRELVVQEKIPVVATLDDVDAETANGESRGPPPPARQHNRKVVLSRLEVDVPGVGGLELQTLQTAEAARVPDHRARVVRDADEGAAHGERAIARARGEY